ncbi:hypothetical protein EGW08_022705, partial [Elysia chlorotica]
QPPNGLSGQTTLTSLAAAGGSSSFGGAATAGSSLFSAKTLSATPGTQGGGFTSSAAPAPAGFGSVGSAGTLSGGFSSTPQSSAFVTPASGQSPATPINLTARQPPAFPGLSKAGPPVSNSAPSPAGLFGADKAKPPQSNLSAFTLSKPAAPAQQTPADVTPGPPVESQKSIDARLDSAFTHNIIEEIRDFQEELRQLRSRAQGGIKSVGTREEMQRLKQDTEKMIHFSQEIKSVTK